MTKAYLTNFGTPGIGVVPYGIHLCHFYATRQELIDGLFPYFLAGLANKERCIWLAGAPFPAEEILKEAVRHPGMITALSTGQLHIVDAAEWYGDIATFNYDDAIQRVLDEETRALAEGCSGLRINGNTGFVPRAHWHRFMEYEARIQERIRDRRIVACCSYRRQEAQPVELLEVVHCHHGALDQSDGLWEMLFTRA